MQKYTVRVRRGFGLMLHQGLERNLQKLLDANAKAPRDERLKFSEVMDLQAALEWIKQESLSATATDESPDAPKDDTETAGELCPAAGESGGVL
jgi:hypothetical protein